MSFIVPKALFSIVILVLLINVEKSKGIIGGQIANMQEWMFLTLIVYDKEMLCSGTLIKANWVLTAARCVDAAWIDNAHLIGVRIGAHDVHGENGRLIAHKGIYIHPRFSVDTRSGVSYDDLALLLLTQKLILQHGVRVLPIARLKIQLGSECWTAGWGVDKIEVYTRPVKYTDDLYPYPHVLRYVKQTPIDLRECLSGLNATTGTARAFLDDTHHACTRTTLRDEYNFTGSETDVHGPTYGDIGSPLVCAGEVFAVAAFGIFHKNRYGPGNPLHLMGWTYLNVHLPWIDTVTKMRPQTEKVTKRVFMNISFENTTQNIWYQVRTGESFGLGLLPPPSASTVCIPSNPLYLCAFLIAVLLSLLLFRT